MIMQLHSTIKIKTASVLPAVILIGLIIFLVVFGADLTFELPQNQLQPNNTLQSIQAIFFRYNNL